MRLVGRSLFWFLGVLVERWDQHEEGLVRWRVSWWLVEFIG